MKTIGPEVALRPLRPIRNHFQGLLANRQCLVEVIKKLLDSTSLTDLNLFNCNPLIAYIKREVQDNMNVTVLGNDISLFC